MQYLQLQNQLICESILNLLNLLLSHISDTTRHSLIGTPSETIPSLQLSGQVKIYVNETSTSEGSTNIIEPSPEAWGPVPVCIPSTPTPDGKLNAGYSFC